MDSRTSFLGASDAPAIFGYSPSKSRYRLWMEKTGLVEESREFIMACEIGNALEPLILKFTTERLGKTIFGQQKEFVHPAYPFIRCHVDGLLSDTENVEAKSGGMVGFWYPEGWGPEGGDEIPPGYRIQAAVQQECGGFEKTIVPVILKGKFRIYVVPRDPELGEIVIRKMVEFWEQVKSNNPPPVESGGDVLLKWPTSESKEIEAPEWIRNQLSELSLVRSCQDHYQGEREKLETRIKDFMGSCDSLIVEGRKVATWKTDKNGKRTFRLY